MAKPFLTYEQQILILESDKPLIVPDHDYAEKTLRQIGYFVNTPDVNCSLIVYAVSCQLIQVWVENNVRAIISLTNIAGYLSFLKSCAHLKPQLLFYAHFDLLKSGFSPAR